MKRTLVELVVILGATVVVASLFNVATRRLEFFVQPGRYPKALSCTKGRASAPVLAKRLPDPAAEAPKARAPAGEDDAFSLPVAGFEEAADAWINGLLFVDARDPEYYAKGHISGAVSVPAWEPKLEARIARLAEEEEVELPIIVYCTSNLECEDSYMVGSHLRRQGFLDVKIYEGGFPEWSAQEMPVTAGAERGPRGPDEESSETLPGSG